MFPDGIREVYSTSEDVDSTAHQEGCGGCSILIQVGTDQDLTSLSKWGASCSESKTRMDSA